MCQETNQDAEGRRARYHCRKTLDWTRQEFTSDLPRHIRTIRSYDWTSTSLGPMVDWPQSLRQAVVAAMSNSEPRLILWGPEYSMIFNEPFISLVGDTISLGQPLLEAVPDLGKQLSSSLEQALFEGQVLRHSRMPVSLGRQSFVEDTYWGVGLMPILSEDDCAGGVLGEFRNNTSVVLGERRTGMTQQLRKECADAHNIKDVWSGMLKCLEAYEKDCPFAILYSVGSGERGSDTVSRLGFRPVAFHH